MFPASEAGPGARGRAAVGVIAPNSCDTESGGADRECLGLAVRRAGPPTPGPWVQGEGKRKHPPRVRTHGEGAHSVQRAQRAAA